jgi:hypothetical protein
MTVLCCGLFGPIVGLLVVCPVSPGFWPLLEPVDGSCCAAFIGSCCWAYVVTCGGASGHLVVPVVRSVGSLHLTQKGKKSPSLHERHHIVD